MRELFEVILAGGGTGGHLFPALAVADELKRRRADRSIGFIGSSDGLETTLVPQAGYPLWTIPLSGMKGAGKLRRLQALAAAGIGTLRVMQWLRGRQTKLVIGAGGFASGPAVLGARWMGKPTLLMEQNYFPGATNRALAIKASAVCLPGEEAAERIGGRRFIVGNPVRPEFAQVAPLKPYGTPQLLVFGGSRGARSINQAMVRALPQLAAMSDPPRIVHQTGPHDEAETCAAYTAAYPEDRFAIAAFLNDMHEQMEAADLILCRSGAGSVAEVAAAGRPSVLIPYPHAADDHQTYNAKALVKADAALMIADSELQHDRWIDQIVTLLGDRERLSRMGAAARTLAKPHATQAIADLAESILEGAPWPFPAYGDAK